MLISPELMVRDGLLAEEDAKDRPDVPKGRVDYPVAVAYKERLFNRAYERFRHRSSEQEYERFCAENASWLDMAEKRRPQDGRIKIDRGQGVEAEIRVSTVPTAFGEKTVMRILDPDILLQEVD
ncbi:MAG: 4-alpha-glucanotransferase, partial [Deltaproteobacteria bacterium]|nr:4-alpha-glucanotransferase [Deltaproteobacteria bacterium]